jgi:hypothetical protein
MINYTINLKDYCEINKLINNSENIGNISNKTHIIDNEPYNLLKYNKNYLTRDTYKTLGKVRSVIYKKTRKEESESESGSASDAGAIKILAFSPVKSLNYDEFTENYNMAETFAEEFIEGTMINVFYDMDIDKWQITTKSNIGAKVSFFDTSPSFAQMFHEACVANNFQLDKLDKKYSYTFILQHPHNRIVMPIIYPTLYLLKVYKIHGFIIEEIDLNSFYNSITGSYLTQANIRGPARYPISSYEELKDFFASQNTPYYIPGIMIYHKDGERTKIRNPNYENVRFLRGNQAKLQYQYLCLRKEDKVKDFLFFYPEHKRAFAKYRNLVHEYSEGLYKNYIECFIKKNGMLKDYPYEFKINMYKLHKKYIEELYGENKSINKSLVIDYINNLEPAQLMYVINYKNYEQHRDSKNAEAIMSAVNA